MILSSWTNFFWTNFQFAQWMKNSHIQRSLIELEFITFGFLYNEPNTASKLVMHIAQALQMFEALLVEENKTHHARRCNTKKKELLRTISHIQS